MAIIQLVYRRAGVLVFPILFYQGISVWIIWDTCHMTRQTALRLLYPNPLHLHADPEESVSVTICVRLSPAHISELHFGVTTHLTAIPLSPGHAFYMPPWNPTASYSRDMLSQSGTYFRYGNLQ